MHWIDTHVVGHFAKRYVERETDSIYINEARRSLNRIDNDSSNAAKKLHYVLDGALSCFFLHDAESWEL